ncbi:MAG: methyltransferase, partial [Planctomycetes bacterium]|nr:methyltransferase [Planctomycetota bacterium]
TDSPSQLLWQTVVNPLPPMEVLSADQVEAIHLASLRLLEDIGMRFLSAEAREVLELAGAEVNHTTQMVRFESGLIEQSLSKIPSLFTLRARNPNHNLTIGDNRIAFTSVAGPAYCSDLDNGRRPGTYAELCDYLRLVQSLNVIHIEGGGAFEPMDLPPDSRHLDICAAQIRLLDKNWKPIVLGRERATDAIDMA